MSFLEISISGGMFILAIAALRAILIQRLPKRTFSLLWKIALLRLLIPVTVTSVFSVYPLLRRSNPFSSSVVTQAGSLESPSAGSGILPEFLSDFSGQEALRQTKGPTDAGTPGQMTAGPDAAEEGADRQTADRQAAGRQSGNPQSTGWQTVWPQVTDQQTAAHRITDNQGPLLLLWGLGAAAMAVWFLAAYLRALGGFRTSLPVSDEFVLQWLTEHPSKRKLSVRYSDLIASPLTYGVFRPVILLPKKTDWENKELLSYVLLHEYIHVRRFDAAFRLLFALALCIHWFNPMVWLMYLLSGRDAELACDEQVVRLSGGRSSYAMVLIDMEAQKSGLTPFCGFNENPLKERIIGIMKAKKATLAASLAAVGIILTVTAAFATSGRQTGSQEEDGASEEPAVSESSPAASFGTSFDAPSDAARGDASSLLSDEDADLLQALEFDGCMQMSVSKFRERFLEQTDTPEYQELLERLSNNFEFQLLAEENSDVAFYFDVVDNLTGEDWEFKDYEGFVASSFSEGREATALSYTFTLIVTDPELLTVGAYDQARIYYQDTLNNLLFLLKPDSTAPSPDKEAIQRQLKSLKEKLESRQTEGLSVSVEYSLSSEHGIFTDMTVSEDARLTEDLMEQIKYQYEQDLAVFRPYGLSWQCLNDGELKMFFEGKEVRGIFDPEQGTWISAHTGNSTYGEDAVDLYTVYENGTFQGLRIATEEEAALWDQIRTSRKPDDVPEEAGESPGDPDLSGQGSRLASPGTKSDYDSLLALKTPGYEDQPLYLFNLSLLEWANGHFGRMERIGEDIARSEYPASLTEEEQDFLGRTVLFSGKENTADIQSTYSRLYNSTPSFREFLPPKTLAGRGPDKAARGLLYEFSWNAWDRRTLTVGERDRMIGGMIQEIRDFWEGTDAQELLLMTEEDLLRLLSEMADRNSSELLTITVSEAVFEKADER